MATGELSDADVFGAQTPTAAPQAAPQAGDGSVVDAPTGTALNPAQTAAYQALLARGKFDPKAEPGSAMLPLHQTREGEEPDAGKFYVDLTGNLKQAGAAEATAGGQPKELSDADVFGAQAPTASAAPVDTRPVSQSLGALEGVTTMFKNGLNAVSGDLPAMLGLPRQPSDLLRINPLTLPLKAMVAAKDAYAKEQEKTYRPGVPGKIVGEVIAGAPLGVDELGVLPMAIMQGSLTTEGKDPLSKLRDISLSAAAGKIGEQIAGGLSNVIAPKLKPAVQWALDNGIRLTPGGIAGGLGKSVETAASKGTIAGPMVGGAQMRGLEDFNLATVRKVLEPAGLTLPQGVQPGHEAVSAAHTALSHAYDALVPNLTLNKDAELISAANAARQAAKTLPGAYRSRLTAFADQISARRGVPLSGDSVQELASSLRQEAADAQRSGDFFTAPYGRALDALHGAVDAALERSNPEFASQLQGLNQGWAQLVRVERAARDAVQDGGVFTPKGLLSAVRATDQSARDNATARGQALMQDWANAGKAVLPDAVPKSGSIWAHLPEIGVALGVGREAHMPGLGMMLGAEGLGGALYTKPAQAALQTVLTKRPAGAQSVADIIDQLRPLLGYSAATAAPATLKALPAPR